ncbi:MAG: PEP-CTERM sorting domain-containing protein [Verrucomicrobiota bacterium]
MNSELTPSKEQLIPSPAIGVSLALAAGASLPAKADAVVIVNTDAAFTLPFSLYINIRFNPVAGTLQVNQNNFLGGPGWNFLEIGGASFNVYPEDYLGSNSFRHYILGSSVAYGGISFPDPPPALDLASLGSGYYWSPTNQYFQTQTTSPGTRFFLGLRTLNLQTNDSNYGWVEFEYSSVEHIRTAFETDANTSIILGQIPEPTSAALLLASGLAGVSAFRRRQKNTSPATSA